MSVKKILFNAQHTSIVFLEMYQLRNVSVSYGSNLVYGDLSLTLEAGQRVAVTGINGTGKTTLLHLLSGLLPPDQGRVTLDGQALDRGNLEQRARIGFLPDFPPLFQGSSILQHCGIWLKLWNKNTEEHHARIAELIHSFRLTKKWHDSVDSLSRGQRYKVALACLATVCPDIWLLDEPYASGMDQPGMKIMEKLMRDASGKGCLIVLTTQMVSVAEAIASDVVMISEKGELEFFGNTAEFAHRCVKGEITDYQTEQPE